MSYNSKKDCEEQLEQNKITNPDYPSVRKIKKMAVTSQQIQNWIVAPMVGGDETSDPMLDEVMERVKTSLYKQSKTSIENTLKYMFYKMRTGIYVSIRQSKVVSFIMFANKDYENDWHEYIEFPNGISSLQEYLKNKKQNIGWHDNMNPNMKTWSANNGLISAETYDDVWGDQNVGSLSHMLDTVCKLYTIPDVDFFINKRDCPYLKNDLTEPYHHLVNSKTMPLNSHKYDSYAPILGYTTSPHFMDIPIPVNDDWELGTGLIFQPNCNDGYQKIKNVNRIPWKDRIPTAFFRGGATGPGTTIQNNQRLKLASLSKEWNDDILDAGITSWNARDKTYIGEPMTYIHPKKLGLKKKNRIPMQEQVKYKFIVYVDGHSAAYRMSSLLYLGSLVLMVDSIEKYQLWYFHLLQPFIHYVPVKSDLSDLRKQIQWCIDNDDKAEQIAKNALEFYRKYLTKENQALYVKNVLCAIHDHCQK